MTTEAAPELDLDAVVAPFRSLDPGLCLAIEGADGTPIASTSLARPASDAITREIAAGALVGGRIRVWGAASGGGLGAAVAESLAAALAAAPVTDLALAARHAADARRLDEELAHGRQPPAQLRVAHAAGRAGLRHRCPLRGGARSWR